MDGLGRPNHLLCARLHRAVDSAIASDVHIGELYPPLVPLTTALLAWLGLYLREPRLRALLPLRGITMKRQENAPV